MTSDLPALAPRSPQAHKGDFGRVQILGGSRGMSGAPALVALAALRSGAGLVQVVCPPEIRCAIATLAPCATTATRGDADDEQFDPTVRAIGPGCRNTIPAEELRALVQASAVPVVLDADGLNRLAEIKEWWIGLAPGLVLTPHPGELKRLLDQTEIPRDLQRGDVAREIARLGDTVVVLKGHRTVVSDGRRIYENDTGNPGMATGGSGDVLTGVIAALIAQHLSPFDAARLGVFLHGLAGDLAAEQLGQVSMTALDVIDHLPQAIIRHQQA